jgi:hypothetical protein
MQEKHLFEYAVIRVVPRLERGEFLNVGVVLYCKNEGFLKAKIRLDEARIKALYPQIKIEEVKNHLKAFEQICSGNSITSPIALLDPASRFRWLTAKRSTVFQTSEVHPGLCIKADETLNRLHEQLVLI